MNGKIQQLFSSTQEIRIGDSLSPFPYTFIVDGLSRILTRGSVKGEIERFTVGNDRVSHLQFADDIILFISHDNRSISIALTSVKVLN